MGQRRNASLKICSSSSCYRSYDECRSLKKKDHLVCFLTLNRLAGGLKKSLGIFFSCSFVQNKLHFLGIFKKHRCMTEKINSVLKERKTRASKEKAAELRNIFLRSANWCWSMELEKL